MTRSKIELATILVKLRGSDEDPAELAKVMSLMKLCYEIQKVEEEREATASVPEATPSPVVTLEPLTKDEQAIVEELKAPEKASVKQKHKHILSWLLDSSSDEES